MYTVILADDEIRILRLLQKLVDWEQLGISIIGEYTDGKEAFDAILSKRPDIVITDIMMSGMTGLDIVRSCIQEKVDSIFLLISGHTEFEYAHMAIQYGVENYLLKPIDRQELEHNLQRICARLNSERMADESKITLENQIQFNKEILNGQFLNNMLFKKNWLTRESLDALLNDYQLTLPGGIYHILAIKASAKSDFTDEQYRLLLKQISHYGVKLLEHTMLLAIGTFTSAKIYLLIVDPGDGRFEANIRVFFEDLRARFYEFCSLTFGISEPADGILDVSRFEAEDALLLRFRSGVNRIYTYSQLPPPVQKVPDPGIVEAFSAALETCNVEGVHGLFCSLGTSLGGGQDVRGFIVLMASLRDTLYSVLNQLYEGAEDLQYMLSDLDALIEQSTSQQEILHRFDVYACAQLARFSEARSTEKHRYIRVAKEYVDAHLAENISLNDIANIVYMNPAYFSTLFKKVTGQNFSDYLETQRIARAKDLLKDLHLSISEVGEQVGYKNARYFSKIFLKKLGIKPSEYRKMNLP